MLIYIPKYKELYSKNGNINLGVQVRGEYRAILRGPSGAIKYDSGWQDNTVLDQGLLYLTQRWGTGANYSAFSDMYLGTSDVAVAVTQVGLQGSNLGKQSTKTNDSATNGGAPNYELNSLASYVYDPGTATGTIKEFVFTYYQNALPLTGATIRVVLTAPIVKGAADSLTMQHRLIYYQPITDVTGTIDISGVNYDYILRGMLLDRTPAYYDRLRTVALPTDSNGGHYASTSEIVLNIGQTLSNPLSYSTGVVNTYGGVAGSYYAAQEITADITTWNMDIRAIAIRANGSGDNIYYQCRLGRSSDDAAFTKLLTHELILNVRTYPTRYVP